MGDLAVLRTHYGIEKLSKPKSKITDKFIGIIPSDWSYATERSSRARRSLIRHKRSPRPQGEDFQGEVTSVQDLTGLDLTDAKKETDGLGVMVGLLLRLHYHTPKGSNLVGTFEPYTGHVIPVRTNRVQQSQTLNINKLTDDSIKLLGSQQGRNIVGAHGGRVKEEPANGPDQMVIDSIPSLVNHQQNHASNTRHASNSTPIDRPDQMMIENTPSLLSRENLKQDQVSREP
ncbi:Sphingoid long-chain base transporter RSB1 [Fusarium oxysporum f. sp. albedinis]|nr:Sphingoid long-chain base transporter RSB1 [Fusarium oxysporum f. sp. albedinis]